MLKFVKEINLSVNRRDSIPFLKDGILSSPILILNIALSGKKFTLLPKNGRMSENRWENKLVRGFGNVRKGQRLGYIYELSKGNVMRQRPMYKSNRKAMTKIYCPFRAQIVLCIINPRRCRWARIFQAFSL